MRSTMQGSLSILGAALFFSCASKPMVAPSSTGVSSGLSRTVSSVADAKKYNDLAVIHNANASTRIERIRAKSVVIQKYWGK